MTKYLLLGAFSVLLLVLLLPLSASHTASTMRMQEVQPVISATTLGLLRTDPDNYDTGKAGVRVQDLRSELIRQVLAKSNNNGRRTFIDMKFYQLYNSPAPIAQSQVTANTIVQAVQFRVRVYNTSDLNASGKPKSGVKAISTTENKIILHKDAGK